MVQSATRLVPGPIRRVADHAAAWVVAYVALWFLVGFLPIVQTDLDIFFWPATKAALAGHPLMVYAMAGHQAYPNANGPVALVPLTAVGVLVRALGWIDTLYPRRAVALAAFSLFILLMAREGVAAIERLRGERPLGRWARPLTYAVLTLGIPVWQSLEGYGHIEQPIEVWLVLVAARWLNRGWGTRAGIAFGLAVLTRSSAGLLIVPFLLSAWRRAPAHAAALVGAAVATGVAGLLPFYLEDAADLTRSMFTYRPSLLVGAGSIWSLTHGTPLEAWGQHADVAFVAGLAITINLWLASRRGGLTDDRLYAGLALTAASFALLAKTVWPYYFFEVFVFGTVWAVGRWRPNHGVPALILPPVVASVFGIIGEFGSTRGLARPAVEAEGVAMFCLLGATMALAIWTASGPSENGGGPPDPVAQPTSA